MCEALRVFSRVLCFFEKTGDRSNGTDTGCTLGEAVILFRYAHSYVLTTVPSVCFRLHRTIVHPCTYVCSFISIRISVALPQYNVPCLGGTESRETVENSHSGATSDMTHTVVMRTQTRHAVFPTRECVCAPARSRCGEGSGVCLCGSLTLLVGGMCVRACPIMNE